MKKIAILLFSVSALSGINVYSQGYEPPKNYVLVDAKDYAPYEKDVIAAANWLIKTPLDEEKSKRRETAKFIFNWISGSPNVNVEINETIIDFEKENPGMMMVFMAGSAKYVLENKGSEDMRAKQKAALKDMITVYKNTSGIHRDKKMEALIKSNDKGTLDAWLDENLIIQK